MYKADISVPVTVCSFDELSENDKQLIECAKHAANGSYAPYSKFNVGAAILMEDGSVFCGSNQENVAFPSGMCAERAAAFNAASTKPGLAMKKIAIAAKTTPEPNASKLEEDCFQAIPISPCGACRQSLLEYENIFGPIEVLLYGREKVFAIPSVSALLPLSFSNF